MHDETVKKRNWFSDQEFLDLVGATNLIPGPNSTEMAIHIGYLRARLAWIDRCRSLFHPARHADRALPCLGLCPLWIFASSRLAALRD